MLDLVRRNLTTVLVAMITAAVTVGGPTIAAKITNADKVDGKHAVGANATVAARAGKLVATNSSGYLPSNIVLKAANADKLDGMDSKAFTVSDTAIQVNQTTPLGKNQSETYTSHAWDPSLTVIWTAVPTSTAGTMNTVQSVELMADGTYRYWITVWNYGSGPSTYKLRRLVISQPTSPASIGTLRESHRMEGPIRGAGPNGSTR
jgi:hypothetical protein